MASSTLTDPHAPTHPTTPTISINNASAMRMYAATSTVEASSVMDDILSSSNDADKDDDVAWACLVNEPTNGSIVESSRE